MNELSQCLSEASAWIDRASCPCDSALAWEWYYQVIETINWIC